MRIFQLGFAQTGLSQVRRLAGSEDGKEGQVGIIGYVGHFAGQASHAQVVRACGVKDMRRSYACISPPPGYDCAHHAAGAAGDELVTGFDHYRSIGPASN